ncbi:hypothetical protein BT93_E2034 [Corymbia citriodora subsp. variegata]|nr:hypothetical protein BT93_E2034 [Corymbia citriodora subsp. variegata]
MAEAIVLRVAKLLDFPTAGHRRRFPGNLDKLKESVSFLQKVVRDAEKRSFESRDIEAWLESLKSAFYDAEDLIQEWNFEVMRQERPSHYEKLRQVTNLSSLLERTGGKIEEIAAEGRGFDFQENAEDEQVERGSRKREQSDSFVHEEEIVGRDDVKSTIMNFLLDSSTKAKVSICSIVSEEGIGKTALARCMYEDDMVDKHFDLRMWVSMSDDMYDEERLFEKIIESASTERADDIELEQSHNQLMEPVRGKKYLLVLDGLWFSFPEGWKRLKSLLMDGAEGSKILVSSRFWSALPIMAPTVHHELKPLSDSSSLDLLMRMACKKGETRDSKKRTIGRQIVESCRGIPLAIRTIGSILFFKKTDAEWLDFEHEISAVSAESKNHSITSTLLKLCYHHLPPHLKECFAFCSLFPRDWVIDKQLFTSLWMAEGFIQPIDNVDCDMQDIAHDYFMDLLRRNFFQDCTKDELGNVTSCKMHDLMYELACRVAGTEYSKSVDERVRHVLERTTSNIHQTVLQRKKCLRTIITQRIILSCQFLRVLEWRNGVIEVLPECICMLKHLTFLDLSGNKQISVFPDSVKEMQALQVLKLSGCCKLRNLPGDIRKLVNLRQLEISNCHSLSHMPRGLGELTLLHTLTDFLLPGDEYYSKNWGGLGELNQLSNLRGSLRIEFKGGLADVMAESGAANLKEKDSLVSLVLQFAGKDTDEILLEELQPSLNLRDLEIRGYGGAVFPSWMSYMPKLVELRLCHCEACKSLPPLKKLPSSICELKHLTFLDLSENKAIVTLPDSMTRLQTLQVLKLNMCYKLIELPRDIRKLVNLRHLEISNCKALSYMPQGMGKLTLLHTLTDFILPGDNSCPKSYGRLGDCSFLAEIGETTRNMEQLKVLNLTCCTDLLISPAFSNFPNLEILILERCSRSVYLDPSVGDLKQLHCLNLNSCTELNMLPAELGGLEALKELLIDETSLRYSPISSLPPEIKYLSKLETLDLLHCDMLHELPALPSSLFIVHLSPKLKEKVSNLLVERRFIIV